MEEKKQTDNGDYQFIRETIIKKRKNKWKRLLLILVGTIFLALIFGVVARICFIESEPFVYRLLGISPTPTPTQPERIPIQIPSTLPQTSPTPSPTEAPTPLPSPTGDEKPDKNADSENQGKKVEPSPTPIYIENRVNANLNDYVSIMWDIRRLAAEAAKSIASVSVITSEVDWFEETYENVSKTSGIILGDNGIDLLILVNADSLTGADRIEVTIGNYILSDVRVIAVDQDYDLAILGIESAIIPEYIRIQLTYAKFGESYFLNAGVPVLAIGNPNGYPGSLEFGLVTSVGSSAYIMDNQLDLYTTDIQEHSDGDGVILNMNGEIIGIITHRSYEELDREVQLFVGITRLKSTITALANEEQRKLFGVTAKEVPKSVLSEIDSDYGIYVTDVHKDTPAEEAGIRKGDILLELNKKQLQSSMSLYSEISSLEIDTEVNIHLLRPGQSGYSEMNLTVKIGKKD